MLYVGEMREPKYTVSLLRSREGNVLFIRKYDPAFSLEGKLVLEIGCSVGGILLAFRDA
jgi:hypothetical protein